MKKKLFITGSILLMAGLFFPGCQKQIKDQPINSETETELQAKGYHKGDKDGCRLTSFDYYDGIADQHQIDYYSYNRGLVDEWAVWYGWVYKMEYDAMGRLKKSKVFEGAVLLYTIHFFYKNDKVVKETWYIGDTNVVFDEVIYTFNKKGQMTRGESFMSDYYTANTYTVKGDLASWKFYVGGSPFVSGDYTHYAHYKNPLVEGTPGISYGFPYINAAFTITKRWYTSEKITYYDEFGNPSVYFDEDPHQTQWQIGSHKYPENVEYIDVISGTHLSVGFEFENCDRGNSHHNKSTEINLNKNKNKNFAASLDSPLSIRSILSGSRNKLKKRINEFRKEMKRQLQNRNREDD